MKKIFVFISIVLSLSSNAQLPLLKIAEDKRSFITEDGKPFFWLGDTGWLLFKKCTKEEIVEYLNKRQAQGFNVIQVMLLHELSVTDVYGDSALINKNVAEPNIKTGGYWDMVAFTLNEAAKRNMYLGLVPVWGGNVKSGHVNEQQATAYANFLAARFKQYNNLIWMNGGDIKGSEGESVWKVIGNTLHEKDGRHLVTFHPRGRSTSSAWFHNEPWLDFNMFQSGHKDYAQDTTEPRMGEDNWRYVVNDFALKPMKPTIDGEPSYENIPHGLHDSLAPRWTADDVRRYAYWSVFAGGAGFTYGENSIMQFKKTQTKDNAFGAVKTWKETIDAVGANQMKYVKQLMLSKPFLNRTPAQEIILNQGEKYNYLTALRVKGATYVYTYTGREMEIKMGEYAGKKVKCSWFDPRNGEYLAIGEFENKGTKKFDPPGNVKQGNDWVLVMEDL